VHDSLSLSELTYSPLSWSVVGSTLIPDPVLLSCGDIQHTSGPYALAEQWEGTLVRLDNVIVTDLDPVYPTTSFYVIENHAHSPATSTDTVYVRTNKLIQAAPSSPPISTELTSITGLGHYENGMYQILPRDADDIVYAGATPPPTLLLAYATSNSTVEAVFDRRLDATTAENPAYYSLLSETAISGAVLDPVGEQIVTLTTGSQTPGDYETLVACCIKSKGGTVMPAAEQVSFRAGLTPISMVQAPISAENDSSTMTSEQVTITGMVTADRDTFITHFYMEEDPGGEWHGIQVYGGVPTTVHVGDVIVVSGYVSEYFYKTELTGIDYLEVVGHAEDPVREPTMVDLGDISTGSTTAEAYEGVLVRCDPVFVADTTNFTLYGEWWVADDVASVLVRHSGEYDYVPELLQIINITGPVDYAYGEFCIEPRRDSDILESEFTIGVDPTPAPPAVFVLEQNFPNPFNPMTTIVFSLPSRGDAKLGIYDVSGRLVRTLQDGVLEAGRHTVTWDGRNDGGREMSSGVYFCKLVTADRIAETKLVLLK